MRKAILDSLFFWSVYGWAFWPWFRVLVASVLIGPWLYIAWKALT
jgi:hypothetical protein